MLCTRQQPRNARLSDLVPGHAGSAWAVTGGSAPSGTWQALLTFSPSDRNGKVADPSRIRRLFSEEPGRTRPWMCAEWQGTHREMSQCPPLTSVSRGRLLPQKGLAQAGASLVPGAYLLPPSLASGYSRPPVLHLSPSQHASTQNTAADDPPLPCIASCRLCGSHCQVGESGAAPTPCLGAVARLLDESGTPTSTLGGRPCHTCARALWGEPGSG